MATATTATMTAEVLLAQYERFEPRALIPLLAVGEASERDRSSGKFRTAGTVEIPDARKRTLERLSERLQGMAPGERVLGLELPRPMMVGDMLLVHEAGGRRRYAVGSLGLRPV